MIFQFLSALTAAYLIAASGASPINGPRYSSLSSCISSPHHLSFHDMVNCLGVQVVAAMDRTCRMSRVELVPGITFVRDSEDEGEGSIPSGRSSRSLDESEIAEAIEALPTPTKRSDALIDMATESAVRFMETHTLSFKLARMVDDGSETSADPEDVVDGDGRSDRKRRSVPENEAARENSIGGGGQGRSKNEKNKLTTSNQYVGVVAVKAILALIGFFFLKTLLVGKLAVFVAALLAFKKYAGLLAPPPQSQPLNYYPPPQAGSTGSAAGGNYPYYSRSFDDQPQNAQQLAYSAHAPQQQAASSA